MEDYSVLERLEMELRHLIMNRLSQLSPNWWIELIPKDVRERADRRKEKEEAKMELSLPWFPEKKFHPIHYVDFPDYKRIITKKENWDKAFESVFKNRNQIVAKLEEMEPIRRSVAHLRPLSKEEREIWRMNSKHILTCIKKSAGL